MTPNFLTKLMAGATAGARFNTGLFPEQEKYIGNFSKKIAGRIKKRDPKFDVLVLRDIFCNDFLSKTSNENVFFASSGYSTWPERFNDKFNTIIDNDMIRSILTKKQKILAGEGIDSKFIGEVDDLNEKGIFFLPGEFGSEKLGEVLSNNLEGFLGVFYGLGPYLNPAQMRGLAESAYNAGIEQLIIEPLNEKYMNEHPPDWLAKLAWGSIMGGYLVGYDAEEIRDAFSDYYNVEISTMGDALRKEGVNVFELLGEKDLPVNSLDEALEHDSYIFNVVGRRIA